HPPQQQVAYVAIDSVDISDGLTYSELLAYEDLPSRAEYVLRHQDILVSNVRPNRVAVSLASTRLTDAIASSGFTLLRMRDDAPVSAELLYAFLRSGFARMQLVRRNRGSMY